MQSYLDTDTYSITDVRTTTHTHLWIINGFKSCDCRYLETVAKLNEDKVASHSSTLPELQNLQYRIRLHPQGNKDSNKDFTFFQCFNNSSSSAAAAAAAPPTPFRAKFKFTVYNGKGEEVHTTVYSGTQQLHGYFEYIRREALLAHLGEDSVIHLLLTITVSFDTVTKTSSRGTPLSLPSPKPNMLVQDLESVFKSEKCYDFTINVGTEKLKAHKVILCARSKVFAAMLEPHTEEFQKSEVTIIDVDSEVMKDLLYYMYTGNVKQPINKPVELLAAADRFELPGLKETTEKHLRDNVSKETVCRFIMCADLYNASDLRKHCLKFLARNGWEIAQSDGFSQLLNQRLDLFVEAFVYLSSTFSKQALPLELPDDGTLPFSLK
ncbi:unnamed protein product [Caenorhabditis bovis]|uniref:BTB domain-containing protein n=1 Tax=Caenorhabditis bovis TaxID=2654633 RepID=A0A8S1EWE1_9PELO|nr:unnamed protein product [Caenorhabditis bovis]